MPTMHQCLQILQALLLVLPGVLYLCRRSSLVERSKPESTSEWHLLRWLMLCVLLGHGHCT